MKRLIPLLVVAFSTPSALGYGDISDLFKKHPKELWTIECNEFTGPGHPKTAQVMADALRKVPQLKAKYVSVESSSKRSRVFYGTYELKYVNTKPKNGGQPDTVIELNDAIKRDMEFIRH